MKTLLTTVAAVATFASAAVAETYTVDAQVTNVEANMVSVDRAVPVERCELVRVPITETRRSGSTGASSGDVLGGMIVGGLLGKGAGGNDRSAAIGAVLGGMIAADNNRGSTYEVVTGYRNENQCYVVNEYTTVTTQDGTIVTYDWNGLAGQLHTYGSYRVGDEIRVNVTIN